MLIAHQIVDILRGRQKHPRLVDVGTRLDEAAKANCASLIENAEKFDFGILHLEAEDRPGHFTVPALTKDEREFWVEGLIPLPARVCWYEWTLGSSRSGLLVVESEDGLGWHVQRMDWATSPASGERGVLYDGIVASINRAEYDDTVLSIKVGGNVELYRIWKAVADKGDAGMEGVLRNNIISAPSLALYLTLMLNSRTTDIVAAPPPPAKVNAKRVKAGRSPLPTHRIVTIVPERFRPTRDPDEAKGTHRPPRLHWRRSHLRHYDHHVPSARWMPSKVHEGKAGWWVAVIPRMIVGRAELGEVSHEYRVAGETAAGQAPSGGSSLTTSGSGTALTENDR